MVETATPDDFEAWCLLAREVEHLFGPMGTVPSFREALAGALSVGMAQCIRDCANEPGAPLAGGIIVNPDGNRIEWLAVSERCRGMGYGRELLDAACLALDPAQPVWVQTFAPSCPDGRAARRLYQSAGFQDHEPADDTPAGVPTVIMVRLPRNTA